MLMKAAAPVKSATAFRTISEVSDELDVPQHVLRFWETKFPQVRPLKRGGGRRYYRPDDVELLRRIQSLLYKEGYTIKGVQRLLKETRGALPAPPPEDEGEEGPDTLDLFTGPDGPTADGPTGDGPTADGPVPEDGLPSGLPGAARREIEAVVEELRVLQALLAGKRES